MANRVDPDQTPRSASDLGQHCLLRLIPVSILHKALGGRYRPVRVADGPITARYIYRLLAGICLRTKGK